MDYKKFLDDNKKTIIIIVSIMIIAFLIHRNWWRIERLLKPRSGENSPIPLTDSRKITLQNIAKAMYQDIEHTAFWTGHDYSSYQQANTLYDDEVKYAADYFKNYVTNGSYSMKVGIDSQIYTWGNEPSQLSARLSELGKL